MDLNLHTRAVGDASVVAASGELDLVTAPELRAFFIDLISAGSRKLVFDMSVVVFFDSTALGALLGCLKRVRTDDGWLRLAELQPQVLKLFEITGLTETFGIYPTVDDALAG